MVRKLVIAIGVLALAFTLGGCKEVHRDEVGAVLVQGTDNLYRFCDGPTLIYFTDLSGSDDEYEAMWPAMCAWNESAKKWEYSTDLASQQRSTNGNMDGDGDK